MKKVLICILILGIGIGTLMAQSKDEIKKQIKIEMEGNLTDVPTPKIIMNLQKDLNLESSSPDAAYFGIYTEDLTFPKAQALGYKGNIGVLVTGVVSNSPAWNHRILEDDIIVRIDGNEVSNYSVFEKLRKQYRAGDTVSLELIRSGEVVKMDFTFGSRDVKTNNVVSDKSDKKKKLSAGYGGGTWIPMWFDTDMTDINKVVTAMGFGKLADNGVLMQGIGGKLPVGKGYFLGGQVVTFEDNKKILDPAVGSQYHIWLRYENSMGGVTLDKRVPITKNFISSAGLMIGGGTHTVEVLKSNSNYNWTDWNNTFLNSNNTHSMLSRNYVVVQPRAELMYRLLPWFGLRAEAGYTYGYSAKEGWRVKGLNGENFEVLNAPNTEYQGLNVTIGPWFGF